MKSIKGSLTSSKPISLSKAASVLHKFINEETGASQAVSVYLKRASAAFDELAEFHNELKGRTHHKHKKPGMETLDNGPPTVAERNYREEGSLAPGRGRFSDSLEEQSYRNSGRPVDDEGINRQSKRKKDFSDFEPEAKVREGGADVQIVEEKREETKKRKEKAVEDGGLNDSEGKKEETKKRKNKEVADGELNDSEERRTRKNKKSKRRSEEEEEK